ncbi:mannosyltransferase [Basidiobolus meristosporus CBS 931.73]|uniref:GPI mannosyltransferase 2 n=1 Tax=Basidiobolus meristosporus CBS 931.73 TaxID=1314790 RepID=A0A1Y1YC94_9FUNG|nr:mannosyltransferase [Basidiobolus meristosporus CBS 931.73]|eukprot:ORX95224.1 mannosyltransferase [Basidiobolus meristosporus CBS 931.73]
MASIFTLHHNTDSPMESVHKRKKGSLVKPSSSSLFALLSHQQNLHYFLLFFLALFSRVLVWGIAFVSNYIIEDYDSSVDLILPTFSKSFIQAILKRTMVAFVRWDAFYFMHVAEEGYVYEQEFAFFPMLPVLMRGLSDSVFRPLQIFFDRKLLLALSGILISNLAFALAAVALYHLSYSIFKKEKFALISALCFCITPSCMFMSSMYTESLFALFSFVGMDLYVHKHFWSAAVVWALGTSTRSNGITYAGFFIFDLCIKNRTKSSRVYMAQVAKAVGLSIVTMLGMMSFQLYGYVSYCVNQNDPRPWCEYRIPSIYSFVQEEYWNCGFLRYYEWKQIPNFLLAAPMVILSLSGIWCYAAHDWFRFFSVGIKDRTSSKRYEGPYPVKTTKEHQHVRKAMNARPVMLSPIRRISANTNPPKTAALEGLFYTDALLPFIYLWGVLLAYCTLAMHIQVITRFFSCMPTVYWFAAHVLVQDPKHHEMSIRLVLFYFITYGLTGIVLFSNFLPPA